MTVQPVNPGPVTPSRAIPLIGTSAVGATVEGAILLGVAGVLGEVVQLVVERERKQDQELVMRMRSEHKLEL